MKIEEILQLPRFEIPHARFRENDTIPRIINKHLELYLKKVQSSNNLFETINHLSKGVKGNVNLIYDRGYYLETIESLIKHLNFTFEAYFANSPAQAYDALIKGLSLPLVQNILMGNKRFIIKRNTDFYRIRSIDRSKIKGAVLPPVTIEDLFHIPYQLRRLITTQRYSMPGFPCLYLGSSLNVAYHEVIDAEALKPTKDKNGIPYAVRLSNSYRLSCFDLSPVSVSKLIKNAHHDTDISKKLGQFDKICKYGVIWPLISSCYFQIAYKNKRSVNFKAEYVIPQLMLQWFQDCE